MAVVSNWIVEEFLPALGLPPETQFIRIPIGVHGPIEVLAASEPLNVHVGGARSLYYLVRRDDPTTKPCAQTGQDLGLALQQALGLPPETTYIGLDIALQHDSIVTVSCYYYPNEEALQRCQEVLSQYRVALPEDTYVQEEKR